MFDEFKKLVYAWLARMTFVVAKFVWRMHRRPKLRAIFLLTIYIGMHTFVLRVLTAFREAGKLTDPEKIRRISAYVARTRATIDRRHALVDAMPGDR